MKRTRISKRLCRCCFAVLFCLLFGNGSVLAAQTEPGLSPDEIYAEQYEESGAGELFGALPEDTQGSMDRLGVSGADLTELQNLNAETLLAEIGSTTADAATAPLRSAAGMIGVILLCALVSGADFSGRPLSGTMTLVGTLCVCTTLILPLTACIADAAKVIDGAAVFTLACVPVLAGLLAAGGQPTAAASYSFLMLGAGNGISIAASTLIVPLLNLFLAFSLVSGISPQIRLKGICDGFSQVVKWILGFATTVFSAVLGMQSFLTSAADAASVKTAKFMVSSFVPVVGGALGDAVTTVQGCVKLLKSGVGAFALLAGAVIFLPVLLRCLLWILTCQICAGMGELFSLTELASVLRAAGKTMGILISVILCCLVVLTVSSVLVITGGGGG